MKKAIKAAAVVLLAALTACGGYMTGQRTRIDSIASAIPKDAGIRNQIEVSAAPAVTLPAAPQTERNITEKTSTSAIQTGWTEVKKVMPVSLDDKTKAELCLSTSAEKDEDGEFLWDDGNQWVLEVNVGNGYYTLLNKYVQLGRVDVMVGADEKGECVITAVTSTGSGLVVEKYTYNGSAFEGQTVYNSGALNVWGSTF